MTLVVSAFLFTAAAALAAYVPQEHQHPAAGAHRHPEAAKLKNPVAADAKSVADGQQLYVKHCATCHGEKGKGDGEMGEDMDPKPADLTDADWKHGSSDGEIFTAIRDGLKNTGMKAFTKKLTVHQLWDVVNYIRSIGHAH